MITNWVAASRARARFFAPGVSAAAMGEISWNLEPELRFRKDTELPFRLSTRVALEDLMAAPTTARPLRADARRNREAIIEAAREVFAERGELAQMDDIARAAG